jgi:hypothetical protein
MDLSDPHHPRRGDRFAVTGRRERLFVARVILSVEEPDGEPWFIVESVHGNQWTLTASQEHDIRWMGEHCRPEPERNAKS